MAENRRYPRFKRKIPVEVHLDGSDTPFRCNTSDISLSGCYIENMYPWPVDTSVDLKLQLEGTLLILGKVVTRDPQFGNGIEFKRMLPEDLDELSRFLDFCADEEASESSTLNP